MYYFLVVMDTIILGVIRSTPRVTHLNINIANNWIRFEHPKFDYKFGLAHTTFEDKCSHQDQSLTGSEHYDRL